MRWGLRKRSETKHRSPCASESVVRTTARTTARTRRLTSFVFYPWYLLLKSVWNIVLQPLIVALPLRSPLRVRDRVPAQRAYHTSGGLGVALVALAAAVNADIANPVQFGFVLVERLFRLVFGARAARVQDLTTALALDRPRRALLSFLAPFLRTALLFLLRFGDEVTPRLLGLLDRRGRLHRRGRLRHRQRARPFASDRDRRGRDLSVTTIALSIQKLEKGGDLPPRQ